MARAKKILPPPALKIDQLDWKILRELDRDSSQSLSHIGKKLGAGRDVIHYRVKRLEGSGVIWKYVARINHFKLGFFIGETFLKFQNDSPEKRDALVRQLLSSKSILASRNLEGKYDFSFSWAAKSMPEAGKIGSPKSPYLMLKDIRILSEMCFFERSYLAPGGTSMLRLEALPQKLTEKTDFKILAALAENARSGHADIAKKLDLTPAQVQYRINKMRNTGVIIGFGVSLDLEKLGYKKYVMDICLAEDIADDLLFYLSQQPNAVAAYLSPTNPGISVEFEVLSQEQIVEIEKEIKKKFKEKIAYIEISFVFLHSFNSLFNPF